MRYVGDVVEERAGCASFEENKNFLTLRDLITAVELSLKMRNQSRYHTAVSGFKPQQEKNREELKKVRRTFVLVLMFRKATRPRRDEPESIRMASGSLRGYGVFYTCAASCKAEV